MVITSLTTWTSSLASRLVLRGVETKRGWRRGEAKRYCGDEVEEGDEGRAKGHLSSSSSFSASSSESLMEEGEGNEEVSSVSSLTGRSETWSGSPEEARTASRETEGGVCAESFVSSIFLFCFCFFLQARKQGSRLQVGSSLELQGS